MQRNVGTIRLPINKEKKRAEIQSINSVADEIFQQTTNKSKPVSSYIQMEQAQRELRCKLDKSDAKVVELEDRIIDQEAALVAKQMTIEDLQKKVTGLETENRALRAKCTSLLTTTATASSTGIIHTVNISVLNLTTIYIY